MKPIAINLVTQKNTKSKILAGGVILFAAATFAITLANAMDYYADKKVVKTYESRLREIKKRAQKQAAVFVKKDVNQKEYQKAKADFKYLTGIIQKNLFPLPFVLSEIERIKTDRININALVFFKNLAGVTIKGDSTHVDSISRFIVDMEKSEHFNIELSREEIKENKKIIFELIARWNFEGNDPKI